MPFHKLVVIPRLHPLFCSVPISPTSSVNIRVVRACAADGKPEYVLTLKMVQHR